MNCLEECNISQVIFMLTKDTALLNQYRTSPITAPRSCKTWIPSQKIDFPQSLFKIVLRTAIFVSLR